MVTPSVKLLVLSLKANRGWSGVLDVPEAILEGADIVKQLRRQQLHMLPPNWKTRGVGESVIAIRRRDKPRQQEELTVSIEKPLDLYRCVGKIKRQVRHIAEDFAIVRVNPCDRNERKCIPTCVDVGGGIIVVGVVCLSNEACNHT